MMFRILASTNQLERIEHYLEKVDETSSVGLFIRGLCHRSKQNRLDAFKCFSRAKLDKQLHDSAIFEMVDMILNLDDLTLFWNGKTSDQDKQRQQRMAHTLLNEVMLDGHIGISHFDIGIRQE